VVERGVEDVESNRHPVAGVAGDDVAGASDRDSDQVLSGIFDVESVVSTAIPHAVFPEITLPAPEAVPPTVLPDPAEKIATPMPELPRVSLPVASVPTRFPSIRLSVAPDP